MYPVTALSTECCAGEQFSTSPVRVLPGSRQDLERRPCTGRGWYLAQRDGFSDSVEQVPDEVVHQAFPLSVNWMRLSGAVIWSERQKADRIPQTLLPDSGSDVAGDLGAECSLPRATIQIERQRDTLNDNYIRVGAASTAPADPSAHA